MRLEVCAISGSSTSSDAADAFVVVRPSMESKWLTEHDQRCSC